MSLPASQPAVAAPEAALPARQRRKLERPQELLDAALSLFVEKGFAATRSEEVAQRAGVSKGTLYLYYPSKEELFKAVVRTKLSNIIAEGNLLIDGHQGAAAQLLQQLMQVWWDRVLNTPAGGIHKIIVAEVRNFPEIAQFYVDEVVKPADALISRVIRRGVAGGEFRDLPPSLLTHVLIAPCIFLATHQHSLGACPVHGPEFDPMAMLQMHLDLILRGLRPDEPPGTAAVRATPSTTAPRTPSAPRASARKARR
jgi:AcrR family transcriptional regulator